MRVLIGADTDDLAELYAVPRLPWLRATMVGTVDGAATRASGKSGSINTPSDKRIFHFLRRRADAIVVGAGTARTEGYRPADRPIVLVSRRAEVPERLRVAAPGLVLMATVGRSAGLAEARALLGRDHVIVAGDDEVDFATLRRALAERGHSHLLCEGGPSLLAQGDVDELDVTVAPLAMAGHHPRIVIGAPVDVPLTLHTLLEDDGTLLARWLVSARPANR